MILIFHFKISVNKSIDNKPWMSRLFINVCKKKNLLYKIYIKERSKEAESKYKLYKN